MKILFLILILTAVSFAQLDTYGPHAGRKDVVKFHLALNAVQKHTALEREIILEAIENPSADLEGRARQVFGKQAGPIFFNIGSLDVSDLRSVYNLPDKQAKSDLIKTWTPERKTQLWRQNFALAIARGLNRQQELFLLELSDALPLTKDTAGPWEHRALELFTRDEGRGIFATIGEAKCPTFQPSYIAPMMGTCVCTTNAGNWSCNDKCSGAGTCTLDPGNCGFLWIYDCNGMCSIG